MNVIEIQNKYFDLHGHQIECEKDVRYYKRGEGNVVYILRDFEYLGNILKQWKFVVVENLIGEFDSDFSRSIQAEFNTTKLLKWSSILLNQVCTTYKLSRSDVIKLYELSSVYRIRGVINKNSLEEFDSITSIVEIPKDGEIFMKNEDSSGKNIISMKPTKNKEDIVTRFMSWYPEFERFLDTGLHEFVFFTHPWVDVDKTREFRLFVYKKKIVTICPQKYFDVYSNDIDHDLILTGIYALQKVFVDKFEHCNFSMDVYWDTNCFKLIEFNQWFNAHPGLFTYDEIKNSCDKINFKYLIQ